MPQYNGHPEQRTSTCWRPRAPLLQDHSRAKGVLQLPLPPGSGSWNSNAGTFNDEITRRVTGDDVHDDGKGDIDDIVDVDDVDNDHNAGADVGDHGVDDGGENSDTGWQNNGRSKS